MQQPPNPYPQYPQQQWQQPSQPLPPQQWQQQTDYTQPQSYQQQPTRPPQPPLQQPPPSRPWWIGVIVLGVIFFSYLLSKSAIQSTSTPSTTTTAPTVIASAITSAVSNTPTPFTVGEQVSVGYWKVSVNSVKTSHGDADFSPKSGNIYLIIDVTVINISGSNQLLASGYYFRLTDSTGQPYDAQFTDFGGPPDGTIIPNGKLRGQLIYVVPTSEHTFTLQVQGSEGIDAPFAIWSIKD